MLKIKEASELNNAENQRSEQRVAERTKALQEELNLTREMNIRLIESEKRFRLAQDISPDGFTILHPFRNQRGDIVDFTVVYENKAIARINGTNPDEIRGKRLLELFPSHKGTMVFETYIDVVRTGKSQILEEVYVGEIVSVPTWLRLVIVSLGTDIAIVAQDVTGRKRAEEERSLLYNTLAASFNEIFIFDSQSLKFRYVNAGALNNLQFSLKDMQQKTPLDIKPDLSSKDFRQLILPLQNGDKKVQVFETVHQRADKTVYPVEVRLQLFNKERVYLAVIQDITERRSAGEKMACQLNELQRWHQLMLNREERVIELKREVNELLAHYGQQPRYLSVDKGNRSTASINKP